jgi:heparosan-N-sulfate-glucuronate 5-epimerase
MPDHRQNLANLLEYFGLESRNYYHSVPPPIQDRSDPMAYYVDFSPRADYTGPFDPSGLPLVDALGSVLVFPTHLSMYALAHLERYRHDKSDEHLHRAQICAEWLAANQQSDGAWVSPFPKKEYNLEPPFRSAMIQGLAISLLCRAHATLGDAKYLESAVRALEPFRRDIRDGGVTTYHDAGPFYEEYPCTPSCHVLNGCIYAMWGLCDLARSDNAEATKLWDSGVHTLIAWLPRYDIGHWSLYHLPEAPRNPSTGAYHRLHINQLASMHALTGEPVFKEYEDKWRGYLDSRMNMLRTLPAKLKWRMSSE